MAKLRNLSINIPLLEEIQEMSRYAKFMKKLMSKKNLIEGDTIKVTHGCSAIMSSKIYEKKEDPELLPSVAPSEHICLRKLYENSVQRPVSILFAVLDKVDKFILSPDFVVLDYEKDQEIPIILGRSFLSTERDIIDLKLGEMRFRVHDNEVSFRVCKTKKQTVELQVISVIDVEIKK
ncbi:uncharacterized protein LOC124892711 [Capsicum annuum]|uniref:uncharacterized protein LOC124892711 n=1 Tax=Capsicum annuum TaxID=4072 RepID=UPI001FB10CC7|nr:uncharacterized protein LOC124892711 [Capsicum annuum]